MLQAIAILIKADACPMKNETDRVAKRYGLPVSEEPWTDRMIVFDGFDGAWRW